MNTKRITGLLLSALLALTFTGCQVNLSLDEPEQPSSSQSVVEQASEPSEAPEISEQPSDPESSEQPSEAPQSSEQPEDTEPQDPRQLSLCGGKCLITLPEDWDGHYVIDDNDDECTIYSKLNYESDPLFGDGMLFTISFDKNFKNEKELEDCYYPHFKYVAQWSEGVVLALLPSDVRYNYEKEDMAEEYTSMYDEIDEVLKTVVIKG